MTITTETSLENFDAWSGAVDRLNTLRENGGCDEVERFLEECHPDGMTDTDVNDYLWFQVEEDFPQYFREDDDEEEDDE